MSHERRIKNLHYDGLKTLRSLPILPTEADFYHIEVDDVKSFIEAARWFKRKGRLTPNCFSESNDDCAFFVLNGSENNHVTYKIYIKSRTRILLFLSKQRGRNKLPEEGGLRNISDYIFGKKYVMQRRLFEIDASIKAIKDEMNLLHTKATRMIEEKYRIEKRLEKMSQIGTVRKTKRNKNELWR